MKKIYLTSIALLHFIVLNAQFSTDYLKAADRYFKTADYSSAATYYERYLQGAQRKGAGEYDPYKVTVSKKATQSGSKQQALYQLAESYRLLTWYSKAEPVFKQLLETDAGPSPLAWYQYATVLRAQAKYAEAEQAFNTFLDKYKTEDDYIAAARRELQNLRFIQQQLAKKDLSLYTVQKIAAGKEGASYAPVWSTGDALLFTATWPDSMGAKKQKHVNHLYQASWLGGQLQQIGQVALAGADMHEGAATLSADGNTMYLTRWKVDAAGKKAAIYKIGKVNGQWGQPVQLNNVVNEPGYNAQQPFLTTEGKYLLYATDKKGGFGGYDLWCAELNSEGQPVATENLGNVINTAFNEEAPYYHTPSGNLVFASNGRVGMGGYDLYYSQGVPGAWNAPENFGYPVNSVKDDIYFAPRSQSGNILEAVLLSSDRTAACCLELFYLSKAVPVDTVKKETPPVVVAPKEPELFKETKLEVRNILFAFNEAIIPEKDYAFLDQVAEYMKAHPQATIEIGAHTDGKGTVAYNKALSARRAEACLQYLVKAGIASARMNAKGYGECCPLENEFTADRKDNPAAREKNRRIEIKLLQ
jgi:OOP family OmpA-OmpF porin